MISVVLRRKEGRITGFTVKGHGNSIACAAVSLMALNTANSIEALTDADFTCEYDPDGGFLMLDMTQADAKADLLLEAMALGLSSVKEKYSSEIDIDECVSGAI